MNASELLANQQKDGDSPIQSIFTGLHDRSRRGIMDGLRRFIEADNRSAVDVGGLRPGTKSFHVKKPQVSEAFPRAVIREGDELTLRAEEVGTQRAFIDTKHVELQRWGGCGLARLLSSHEQRNRKRGMRSSVLSLQKVAPDIRSLKKTSESHKVRARWAMNAARGRDDGCFTIQLAKKIFQAEPKPVLEIPTGVGCLLMLTFGFTDRRCRSLCLSQWRSASLVQRFCKKLWEGPYWAGV